jgi:hypothetical protein
VADQHRATGQDRTVLNVPRCGALSGHIDLPHEQVALGLYDLLRVDEACDARVLTPSAARADFYVIELRSVA